ncbi:hypothetical protein AGOR_G00103320 [Albula goreensis]|uniref:Cytosolic 5'-nucleotidase 1A n=1 Tax=Albula goreensis TaxID=1534307 RepID=A0A8T3DJD9_9TELE|nr:hypothetical protein AGOR_G00103320 [Albula goreensis]
MTVNAHLRELYPDANGWNLCKIIVLNDCTLTAVQLTERIQEHGLQIEGIRSGDEWPEAKLYLFTDVVKVKKAIGKGFEAAHVCKTEDAVTIVISSSALFNTDDDQQSVKPGAAFPFVKAMMTVNTSLRRLYPDSTEVFNIVLLNDDQTPSAEEKLRESIGTHDLEIQEIHSIGGDNPVPYLKALRAKLYLCMDTERAKEAITKGFAAAVMFKPRELILDLFSDAPLRVAFDGDAVVFCDESERAMHQQGLEAFLRHEQEKEDIPLEKGPLTCFLEALGMLQQKLHAEDCPIRTYLVTSRDATTSGARVMKTLKSWGLQFDETHFLAGAPKGPVLETICPHIFFDDQKRHIESAQEHGIIAAHVPYGIKNE